MSVIVGVIVGFLAGRLIWLASRGFFHHPVFLRENYRGVALPTGVGICVVFVAVFVETVRVTGGVAGIGPQTLSSPRLGVLLGVLGYGLVGLLDDIAGDGSVRGFRGHLRALSRGQLTSGSLKLLMGGLLGILVASFANPDSIGRLLIDAALIALTANLINLFDRAPGRSIKFASLIFVIVAVGAALPNELTATAVIIGASAALFLDDMRERIMLGDAGANAIGAALGAGIVFSISPSGRSAALIAIVVLNIVSELVSFSRVINAVGPMRAADQAGRRQPTQ